MRDAKVPKRNPFLFRQMPYIVIKPDWNQQKNYVFKNVMNIGRLDQQIQRTEDISEELSALLRREESACVSKVVGIVIDAFRWDDVLLRYESIDGGVQGSHRVIVYDAVEGLSRPLITFDIGFNRNLTLRWQPLTKTSEKSVSVRMTPSVARTVAGLVQLAKRLTEDQQQSSLAAQELVAVS